MLIDLLDFYFITVAISRFLLLLVGRSSSRKTGGKICKGLGRGVVVKLVRELLQFLC